MKNKQQTTFHNKVSIKRRVKNQAFKALTHTRQFLMVSNFFGGTFLQFYQMFCTQYTLVHATISLYNVFKDIFIEVLQVLFWKLESQKRKKRLTMLYVFSLNVS